MVVHGPLKDQGKDNVKRAQDRHDWGVKYLRPALQEGLRRVVAIASSGEGPGAIGCRPSAQENTEHCELMLV